MLRVRRKHARVLTAAGRLATEQGDLETAERLYESSLALAQELGDERRASAALGELGTVALRRCDYARARVLLEEGVAIDRATGELPNAAVKLHQLALVDVAEGDLAEGKAHFEESIALARETGSTYCLAGSLRGLAGVLLSLDKLGQVVDVLEEGLRLTCEVGDRQGVAEAVEEAAMLATARGESATGALLLGASERAHESIGRDSPPHRLACRRSALSLADADPGGRHLTRIDAVSRSRSRMRFTRRGAYYTAIARGSKAL